MDWDRQKWIVIHGWGGTLADALALVRGLFDFEAQWSDGAFYVERRMGSLLRQVLNLPEPTPLAMVFQRLIVGRLLASTGRVADPAVMARSDAYTRISEDLLRREFGAFGIPLLPGPRLRRAGQLVEEATAQLRPLQPVIEQVTREVRPLQDEWLSEVQARKRLREALAAAGHNDELLGIVQSLRDMQETGGDLDTVASAVFYTHWLLAAAAAEGRRLRYGLDYRYVFLNYHETLRNWGDRGPADVFMADLPIGALPEFEPDARWLMERDIRICRYEDHHPYTRAHLAMFERLKQDGVVPYYSLSGPLQDAELDPADMRCGADMVFDSTIAGRPWDNPGARSLKRAAHAEDLVAGHDELGRQLTELIKGGACKTELAQTLLGSFPADGGMGMIRMREWDVLSAGWKDYYREIEPSFMENVRVIKIHRPTGGVAPVGRRPMGPGSDMPMPGGNSEFGIRNSESDEYVRILVAQAVRNKPGKPKVGVGNAQEFFARTVPDADYLFYCYGSSILVARRLNQADLLLNLGAMMPRLGGAGDGGHAGAAVCRPENNPAYPRALLGRVNDGNFGPYARYLAYRLAQEGHAVVGIEDRSRDGGGHRGGRQLAIVTLVALLAGILLVTLNPRYRPAVLARENADFYPQLAVEASDAVTEGAP